MSLFFPQHKGPQHRGRAAKLLGIFILALLPLTGALPNSAAAQSSALYPANPYGVNIFLHKEVEAWKIEQTLRMVSEANVQWVKQEFPWQEIEFRKGYFTDDKWNKSAWEKYDNIVNLADKYKLTLIARVDHAPDWARSAGGTEPLNNNKDLADFINALLDHYKGKIKYVQVWNEPNLAGEWVPGKAVDPASYAQMLKDVYSAVKPAHPDAVILSAPMAMTLEGPSLRGNMNEIDYWNGLYSAGVKGNFDIASANGYGLDQPPDAPPDPKVLNFRRAELLRDIMVQNGDSARPIWFDEYGWNASPDTLSDAEKNYWRHVTPQQQAQWTVDGIEYARKNWPWAGVISVWYFRQVGDIPPEKAEYYFAMLNPDFSPNPIYNAVKADAAQYPGPAGQPQPPPTPTKVTVQTAATDTPTSRPAAPTATTAEQSTATTMPLATVTSTAVGTATDTATPPASAATTFTATPTPSSIRTPGATSTAVAGASSGGGSNNTALFVIGGILVVGGLAALGYYFIRNRTAAS